MPGSYIFLFCLASPGRILSETKGDRRHVEREIQMLMVNLRNNNEQLRTPPIKHESLRIFLIQLFSHGKSELESLYLKSP